MSKIQDFPLEKYGDQILDAMEQVGIQMPIGIAMVVIDGNGRIATTSNLPPEAELTVYEFVVAERSAGRATGVVLDGSKPS